MPKGMDELLNPIDTTGSNPNKDSPCLELQFERFGSTVVYPSINEVEDYAEFASKLEKEEICMVNILFSITILLNLISLK